MKRSTNIEAEGGEMILRNSAGDYAIIPKHLRQEVQQLLSNGCYDCIDSIVNSLPTKSDYAADGLIQGNLTTNIEQRPDAVRTARPVVNEKIPLTQEQIESLRIYGTLTKPAQRETTVSASTGTPTKALEAVTRKKIVDQDNAKKAAETYEKNRAREAEIMFGYVLPSLLPGGVAGEIAGGVVEAGTQIATGGKKFGETVLPNNPEVGAMLNPGYFYGGGVGLKSIKKGLTAAEVWSGANKLNFFQNLEYDLAAGKRKAADFIKVP